MTLQLLTDMIPVFITKTPWPCTPWKIISTGYPPPSLPMYFILTKKCLTKQVLAYPDGSWDWDKLIEVGKEFVKDLDGDGVIDQYG